MHRLAVKKYAVMALQYCHGSTFKRRLGVLCVLICVSATPFLFWLERLDSSGTTGNLLTYLSGELCKQNEKGISSGTSTSNAPREHEIVVSVDSENSQNWTLYEARLIKRHNITNILKLPSYHNLVLEAHEWGIKPSASNRTNSRFLIYNRVPKCASSTLWKLLSGLQRKHNFKYYHSKIFGEKSLTMQQEKEFLKWLTVTKNANFVYPFAFISPCKHLCMIKITKVEN